MNVQEIRKNLSLRDDFLFDLARANVSHIARVATQFIGKHATEDVIRNEATQAFYIGANRGIDSYKAEDDGRGNYNLLAFCRWRGLNNVKDWCRIEYGTDTRSMKKRFEHNVVLESDILSYNFQMRYFMDAVEYDNVVVSLITIQELIRGLSPVDRSIIQLLLFGKDDYGTMRNASTWGSHKHHIAGDIALTIGLSQQYVYQRMSELRKMIGMLGDAA